MTRNASKALSKTDTRALSAAFDVVFTTNDFLANVIASGEYSKDDLALKKKCDKFLVWYKKKCRQN